MSWFSLQEPVGTNWRLNTGDLKNTKQALTQHGYYRAPPERGIDDWADTQMFDGIRAFQKDNGLKVDAFMRPGGPTEKAINANLAAAGSGVPNSDSGGVVLAVGKREPNVSIPSEIGPNQRDGSGRPVLSPVPRGWEPEYPGSGTYWGTDGNLYRREKGWFGPTYKRVPGRSRSTSK